MTENHMSQSVKDAKARERRLGHRHQSVQTARSYFASDHLSADLAGIVESYANLADQLIDTLKDGPATAHALNWLIISKDWAVRQMVTDRPVDDDTSRRDRIERQRAEVEAWDRDNGGRTTEWAARDQARNDAEGVDHTQDARSSDDTSRTFDELRGQGGSIDSTGFTAEGASHPVVDPASGDSKGAKDADGARTEQAEVETATGGSGKGGTSKSTASKSSK